MCARVDNGRRSLHGCEPFNPPLPTSVAAALCETSTDREEQGAVEIVQGPVAFSV